MWEESSGLLMAIQSAVTGHSVHFQLGRGRDGPKVFLAGFNGILQTGGYAAYDKSSGPKLVHTGRSTHSAGHR